MPRRNGIPPMERRKILLASILKSWFISRAEWTWHSRQQSFDRADINHSRNCQHSLCDPTCLKLYSLCRRQSFHRRYKNLSTSHKMNSPTVTHLTSSGFQDWNHHLIKHTHLTQKRQAINVLCSCAPTHQHTALDLAKHSQKLTFWRIWQQSDSRHYFPIQLAPCDWFFKVPIFRLQEEPVQYFNVLF